MSLEDWAVEATDTSVMARIAVFCERCDNISIVDVDISTDYETQCPRCGAEGFSSYDNKASSVKTCLEKDCSNYLKILYTSKCEGNRNSNECKKPAAALDDGQIDKLPLSDSADKDEKDPKIVRRLKALLQKAESYVESSGSHHKSSGGRHGSGATEMHSGAHAVKAQHREKYAGEIQAILDEDREGVIPKSLEREAKDIIGRVLNK